MRVIVVWSGGKDVYVACHKAIEQGHSVVSFLTFVYLEPYIFHSLPIMELQSKALGIPQLKVNVKHTYQDILAAITCLCKEEGVEGIVTGDIDNLDHKRMWNDACKKLGMKLIMPLWDRPPYPKNRYRERVLNMEISTGMKAVINCVDQKYFGEEWLGREFNAACVQDMKALVGPPGAGIDAAGEFGEYHTTVLDGALFKQAVEVTKFSKKCQAVEFSRRGRLPSHRNFFYMDIEGATLKPKKSPRLIR